MTDSTPPLPPAPAYAPAAALPATGTASYGFGFLAYIPIPVVSLLVAAIVMIALRPGAILKGGVAAENGRRAANWGLTILTVYVVIVVAEVVLGISFAGSHGFFPIGAPVLLYLALCVAHLVVVIAGTVSANRGHVFDNKIAIPYFR
jgi:uncharacterized Tic20 family protein